MKTRIVVALLAAVLLATPAVVSASSVKKAAAKTSRAAKSSSKAVGHGAMTAKRKTVSGAKFMGRHIKRAVTP